jgi:hypothetical protein
MYFQRCLQSLFVAAILLNVATVLVSGQLKTMGCFNDHCTRDLDGFIQKNVADLSGAKCSEICRERGFAFAGTQEGFVQIQFQFLHTNCCKYGKWGSKINY